MPAKPTSLIDTILASLGGPAPRGSMLVLDLDDADEALEGYDTLEARYETVVAHLAFLVSAFRDYALGGPMMLAHLQTDHHEEVLGTLANVTLLLHALDQDGDLHAAIQGEIDRGALGDEDLDIHDALDHIRNTLDIPFHQRNQKAAKEAAQATIEGEGPGEELEGRMGASWSAWIKERTSRGVRCLGGRAAEGEEGHAVPGKGEA